MEWKMKDEHTVRTLFRQQVEEATKKKDRSVTISYYDDSVTVSVLPLIEEESTKESEWEQYCENDINLTKHIYNNYYNWRPVRLNPEFKRVVIVCDCFEGVIEFAYLGHIDILSRNQHWFSARNDEPLYFTPKYWMPVPKFPKEEK